MTTLQQIEALEDALLILSTAIGQRCQGSTAVFCKVDKAYKYLDRQIADLLADDTQEVSK